MFKTIPVEFDYKHKEIVLTTHIQLMNVRMQITTECYDRLKIFLSWEDPPADWYFDNFDCNVLYLRYDNPSDSCYKFIKDLSVFQFDRKTYKPISWSNGGNVTIPNFLLKFVVKDLSNLSPFITRFIPFEEGIYPTARDEVEPHDMKIILKIYPALYWVTECKAYIEHNFTTFFFGYDGYYVGCIEKQNAELREVCYRTSKETKVCICGDHYFNQSKK